MRISFSPNSKPVGSISTSLNLWAVLGRSIASLFLLAGHSVSGASQDVTGPAVRGQVVDQAGAGIANAKITLIGQGKDLHLETADQEGRFAFSEVPVGRYRMTVEATGFSKHEQALSLSATGANGLKIVLGVAALEGEVEVKGERRGLSTEAQENASAVVLRGDVVRRLPRGEQQLMQVLERMAGALTRNLDISVNGMSGASLPPAATIKEIRINSDPFAASYHEPGMARVEIETKGGEEQRQAGAFFNYRNSAFDARNAFSAERAPLEYRDVGGWWSSKLFGPRSFIFGYFERQHHEETSTVSAYLLDGYFTANVPSPSTHTLTSLRADFLPSERHTISLLFNLDHSREQGQGITSTDLPERAFDTRSGEQRLQASMRSILSPRLVNEAQLRVGWERMRSSTENPDGAVEVAGAFTSGGPQCCPERRTNYRWSLADNLSLSLGRHFLKVGGGLIGARISDDSERNFGGSYFYSGLTFYRLRRPTLYTINTGDPHLGFGLWQFAAYVQDDIRLKPNFTLSPGLRYEAESHLGDHHNFAPRLGFAWSPFKGQSTVIRGGAGIFYQQLDEGPLGEALRYDGVRQRQIIIFRPRLPDPFGGRPLSSFPVSIDSLAPDLRTPYQLHAALGVERRLFRDMVVTATYNYVRGVHLFRSRDTNAPLPDSGLRPRPEFGRVIQLESSSTSTYHGLTLGLSQTLNQRVTIFGNYTLSRSVDDADGPGALPVDNYNVSVERGYSAQDMRHQVFVGALLTLPFKLEASPMVSFNTGRPYNVTTGLDDNNDTMVNDRPAGVRRNSGRGANYASVDLRLGRRFTFGASQANGGDERPFGIELAVETTNLFNRVNRTDFIGVQTSPSFGRANAALSPRQMMWSVNFNFH